MRGIACYRCNYWQDAAQRRKNEPCLKCGGAVFFEGRRPSRVMACTLEADEDLEKIAVAAFFRSHVVGYSGVTKGTKARKSLSRRTY